MKILLITPLYPPHTGGTHPRSPLVYDNLRLRGHQVRVLTSMYGMNKPQRGVEVDRRFQLHGMLDHPLCTGFTELKALELANHQVLREGLAEFVPDLVYVFSLEGFSKSLLYTLRNARVPTVFDVSDGWMGAIPQDPWLAFWNRPKLSVAASMSRSAMEMAGQRNQLDELAPTRLMKGYDRLPELYGDREPQPNSISAFRFDRIFFSSQWLKELVEQAGFKVRHGEVIYPGVVAQRYVRDIKPPTAPMTRFLMVTPIDRSSGILTAVEALAFMRKQGAEARLTVYGRGDKQLSAELRSRALMHQLPVEFANITSAEKDLPGLYAQHDGFIDAHERPTAFTPTVLEAMAAGLPVVSTALGGVAEILVHGENAIESAPGDAGDLASRLIELQEKPALRTLLAENAQTMVMTRFNDTAVMDQVETFLQTTVEQWEPN